jgi:hypothetical protein
LKEEALDRTRWRARFGRGFGPVVRKTTKWNECHLCLLVRNSLRLFSPDSALCCSLQGLPHSHLLHCNNSLIPGRKRQYQQNALLGFSIVLFLRNLVKQNRSHFPLQIWMQLRP